MIYTWSTYRAVLLKTRNIGTSPFEVPLVPAMYELNNCKLRSTLPKLLNQNAYPVDLMQWTFSPIPPADLEIRAHCLRVS